VDMRRGVVFFELGALWIREGRVERFSPGRSPG